MNIKIIYLIATTTGILLVYQTKNSFYSYQILFSNGSVYHSQGLYPQALNALQVGRGLINIVTGS